MCDNCPNDTNENQADADEDQVGDVCDNCPTNGNNDQSDEDEDEVGDICDNCPKDANPNQANSDADPFGDVCDNCPNDTNEDQADEDGDGVGDACDICEGDDATGDPDGDGICSDLDNCPNDFNPNQEDEDDNGQGDVCGDQDGDGFSELDGDCDDTNPDIHPNAPQSCGGLVDNNCDGIIPDVLEISATDGPTAVGSNFIIELTVTGGTAPFSFTETHTGSGLVTLNTVGLGMVSINAPTNVDWEVTVTDANDCEATITATDANGGIEPVIIDDFDVTLESGAGQNDGAVDLTVTGGDTSCGELDYDWSGPSGFTATTEDITGLASGTYDVVVTDCSDNTTFVELFVGRAGSRGGRGRSKSAIGGIQNIQLQARPNPFSNATSIEFSLSKAAFVDIRLYDMAGKEMAKLLEERVEDIGVKHVLPFDSSHLRGGMYLLQLQTDSGVRVMEKLLIVK